VTRQELRNKLARAMDTEMSDPAPWSTTQLDQVLGEAHQVLCELTGMVERTVYLPLRGATWYYKLSALSTNIILPRRLMEPNSKRRLTARFLTDLDEERSTWETVTGNYPEWWAPVGLDWIAISPSPATGGSYLLMDCWSWPDDALGDGQYLELTGQEEDALLAYAMADCNLWNWKPKRSADLLNEFATMVPASRMRTRLSTRQHSPQGSNGNGTDAPQ